MRSDDCSGEVIYGRGAVDPSTCTPPDAGMLEVHRAEFISVSLHVVPCTSAQLAHVPSRQMKADSAGAVASTTTYSRRWNLSLSINSGLWM